MRTLLLPLSLLYGLAVTVRNALFDLGVLKSRSFSKAIISVGNLNAGGSGKTPHVEYLIRLLQGKYKVATLSRGYKRKSKGYLLADAGSSAEMVGDEPAQFASKFGDVLVAVDEHRIHGIEELSKLENPPQVILLDDAYQHRWVRPGLSVLLTDYSRPYHRDRLLPAGLLREPRKQARRADIIIVSKSPSVLNPIDRRLVLQKLDARAHQKVFFSFLKYGELTPVAGSSAGKCKQQYAGILCFCGIANPDPLEEQLRRRCTELHMMKFRDHHIYTTHDLVQIRQEYLSMLSKDKILVTTEKDLMRLRSPEILELIRDLPLYFLPVESEMHRGDKEQYDQIIMEYVRKAQEHN